MTREPEDTSTELLLKRLVRRSGSLTGTVISKEGHNLAEAGDVSYLNTTALAALVAGSFSATREVARMVGEDQFSVLLQQGETRHIHISLITPSHMMVLIFEDYQRIGRVRHEARKLGQKIADVLTTARDESAVKSELKVDEFKEYALNLVDRIFAS